MEIQDEAFNGMIMVDDKIYTSTGYEVPVEIDRGAMLGKITSTVKEYEMPMENGQANFEIKGARFAQSGYSKIDFGKEFEAHIFGNIHNMI